jgi:carboxylesterase
VADAEAALKDLLTEADKAIVFGHSMGGLVVLTLAADHPDVIDSIVVAAAAVQLTSPLAPGRPFHFLAPLVIRLLKKADLPAVYADPALAQYDTNYPWAPADAVASLFEFAKVTRRRLPEPDQKRFVWFEVTEHEMFRDCESEATIGTVVDYVRERAGLTG